MEKNLKLVFPDWFKGYFFTHTSANDIKIEDRPIEYVYYAIKQRPFLLSIINDNFKFCIEDPEIKMRKLYNCIGDIFKRFK